MLPNHGMSCVRVLQTGEEQMGAFAKVAESTTNYWFNAHGIFQPRGRRGRSEVQAEPHGAAAEAHLDEEQMARGVAMPRTLHTCITGQTAVSDRRPLNKGKTMDGEGGCV